MSDENVKTDVFGETERDAIGEVMNITMGSAATAVSNMLSAKVWITTPTVSVEKAKNLVYPELEPSIHVKIKYIQGVSGDNVLVLKQDDVQLILNQLMGLPLEVTDDFEFDEMNISAVCEVMNQMMGASATALSELIGTTIDISTPEAKVSKPEDANVNPYGIDPEEDVCVIKFKLTIDNVINSEFISVLSIPLANDIAKRMLANFSMSSEPEPEPEPEKSSDKMLSQEEIQALLNSAGGASPEPAPAPTPTPAPAPAPTPAPAPPPTADIAMQQMAQPGSMPQMQQMPQMAQPMQQAPQMAQMQQPMGQPPYGGYPYPPQPMGQPYGYMPQGMPPVGRGSAVNVQSIQLQSFDNYTNKDLNNNQNDNLRLLMGIPLDVTVEIGSATKKVKEILDFTQGTIIELERQAGAPVDVIVNGHLIAKGDVVVIDDNFAVRITEIVKSKFLDNLGKEN